MSCVSCLCESKTQRSNYQLTNLKIIASYIPTNKLSEDQVHALLEEFCSRKVMIEDNETFLIQVPLFERWLVNVGINAIILDSIGTKIADMGKSLEDKAYVLPQEIIDLIEKWPLYQGTEITTDKIRAWLQQEQSQVKQRLMFTLIKNIKFPKEKETNQLLIDAHDTLKKYYQGAGYVTKRRTDRRKDIIVTYVDGAGKSGAYFAPKYARGNKLSTSSTTDPKSVNHKLIKAVNKTNEYSGIIIIDDFIGTGESITKNMKSFIDENKTELNKLGLPIRVVVLYATQEGENNVLNSFKKLDYADIDLHVCEILENRHFAFISNTNIWKTEDDKTEAKQLCESYGMKLSKRAPLGYKSQGLLVAFPRNCPNNSLPILHAHSNKSSFKWKPLFERTIA